MKRSTVARGIFFLLAVLLVIAAAAEISTAGSLASSLGVAPYPSKGQSAQKQNQDEGECFAWAKQQTGIDPIAAASAPPPAAAPAAGGGERVRGAARGAVGGAAIGAIAGDAGKGAGIGAVAGTMAGGKQARTNQAAQQQQAQQAKAGASQQFNKAFGACMEGRGYSVK